LPNITPIFIRIWLMKTTQVWLLEMVPELAERLAHQPGLDAHVRIAHLALELCLGDQGRHRIDDQDVDGPGAHQHLGDLQPLLAGVRLGQEQVVGADPQLAGVAHVHGVLRVDVAADAALLLGLGHHVEAEGGLAGGLRAVDLHDAAPGDAAHPEGDVQRDGAGGDDLDVADERLVLAEPHDGALAELALHRAHRQLDRLFLLRIHRHGVLALALVGLNTVSVSPRAIS